MMGVSGGMTGDGTVYCGAPLAQARVLCLLVHGRGQIPQDMVALAGQVDLPGVAYVLPCAPGKSWYKARAVDPMTAKTRAEVDQSLLRLDGAVAQARQISGAAVPLVVAGFSQGACLALEYAVTRGPWPGAVVALTGARIGGLAAAGTDLAGMPVYLSGGDDDAWIGLAALAQTVAVLGAARAAVTCQIFPGREHAVSAPEIAALRQMLVDQLSLRSMR